MRFADEQALQPNNRRHRAFGACARAGLFVLAIIASVSCSTYAAVTRQTSRAPTTSGLSGFTDLSNGTESVRVLRMEPGVTATIVIPATFDPRARVDLILYALPNGNTTAQTIGHKLVPGDDWHFDIQNIGAQTRALRSRGLAQAVVVYFEATTKSWPDWRRVHGYELANTRIIGMVNEVRGAIGNPFDVSVTLTGHSGGGSFIWGFIEGQMLLPPWLSRVAFLDANYSFEPRHGEKMAQWLRDDPGHTMIVIAYDDREIMLDGKKVVDDSGGTWRATQRMLDYFQPLFPLVADTVGEFQRYRSTQIEMLRHPNLTNRILHTELVGEMNGYMHALLVRTPRYDKSNTVLRRGRAYSMFMEDGPRP